MRSGSILHVHTNYLVRAIDDVSDESPTDGLFNWQVADDWKLAIQR